MQRPEDYGITRYTVREDGRIDVHQDVNLRGLDLEAIPFSFGEVYGSFDVSNNKLTSLKGGPSSSHSYYCQGNRLVTLLGAPRLVCGDFDCSSNLLTSLEGGPAEMVDINRIRVTFNCSGNRLVNLVGAPLKAVTGREDRVVFKANSNMLQNLTGITPAIWRLEALHNPMESLDGFPAIAATRADTGAMDDIVQLPEHLDAAGDTIAAMSIELRARVHDADQHQVLSFALARHPELRRFFRELPDESFGESVVTMTSFL